MSPHNNYREREPDITPKSRVSMSVYMFIYFAIGVGTIVWGTAAILNRIDSQFANTVTIPQFQGWASQLQDENPTLHVRIPGVRAYQDVTGKRTTE